jgi:hypothetical protein
MKLRGSARTRPFDYWAASEHSSGSAGRRGQGANVESLVVELLDDGANLSARRSVCRKALQCDHVQDGQSFMPCAFLPSSKHPAG